MCTRYVFIRCLFIIYQNDITDLHIYFSMFFFESRNFSSADLSPPFLVYETKPVLTYYVVLHTRPVNLYSLFLFWKHESVCDPEKRSKIWVANSRVQKTGSLLLKKRRGSLGPFFQSRKLIHVFKTRIVGADWLGVSVKGLAPFWKTSINMFSDSK